MFTEYWTGRHYNLSSYNLSLQENLVTVSKYHTAVLRSLTPLSSTTLLYKEFVVLY